MAKEKGMNRDDRIHGALLILNELVRISSMEGEVRGRVGRASGCPPRAIPGTGQGEVLVPPEGIS